MRGLFIYRLIYRRPSGSIRLGIASVDFISNEERDTAAEAAYRAAIGESGEEIPEAGLFDGRYMELEQRR
jgi:hypothetical protein